MPSIYFLCSQHKPIHTAKATGQTVHASMYKESTDNNFTFASQRINTDTALQTQWPIICEVMCTLCIVHNPAKTPDTM